jgi:putative hydrolase of HD superfamily
VVDRANDEVHPDRTDDLVNPADRARGDATSASLLAFLKTVGALKRVPRQGWVDRGIDKPESVADHTYRNAMMAWALGQSAGLDTSRLVKLMLLHDLAEVEVGDATPYGHLLGQGADSTQVAARWRELVTPDDLARVRADKHQRESEAMAALAASLPAGLRQEMLDLWADYAQRRSPEARFAAQVDKIEALLEAIELRAAGQPADVENFLVSAREVAEHPVLVSLLAEIEATAK